MSKNKQCTYKANKNDKELDHGLELIGRLNCVPYMIKQIDRIIDIIEVQAKEMESLKKEIKLATK